MPPAQRMAKISSEKIFLITIFNVLVPSLDQATDINMVRRLLAGPEKHLQIYSGGSLFCCQAQLENNLIFILSVLNFPTRQVFNGSFADQNNSIQKMYQMVIFHYDPFLGNFFLSSPTCFLE